MTKFVETDDGEYVNVATIRTASLWHDRDKGKRYWRIDTGERAYTVDEIDAEGFFQFPAHAIVPAPVGARIVIDGYEGGLVAGETLLAIGVQKYGPTLYTVNGIETGAVGILFADGRVDLIEAGWFDSLAEASAAYGESMKVEKAFARTTKGE